MEHLREGERTENFAPGKKRQAKKSEKNGEKSLWGGKGGSSVICRRGAYEVLKLQQEGVPTDGTAKKGGSSFDFFGSTTCSNELAEPSV